MFFPIPDEESVSEVIRVEIDVFFGDNEGLIVAEVELASVDEEVKLPDWIYKEVSDDKRYYNSSLCLKPYTTW